MDKGIYCLIFENPTCTIGIGALGPVPFPAGWHIYIGSALGSGGLARLFRHVTLSRGKDRTPTWHVDYLSTNNHFVLRYTIHAVTDNRFECRLAEALGGPGIPCFGCSDCTCPSHLLSRRTDPKQEILSAFRGLGLVPVTKTIISP
jgi:Uri superfamily endonuclease